MDASSVVALPGSKIDGRMTSGHARQLNPCGPGNVTRFRTAFEAHAAARDAIEAGVSDAVTAARAGRQAAAFARMFDRSLHAATCAEKAIRLSSTEDADRRVERT